MRAPPPEIEDGRPTFTASRKGALEVTVFSSIQAAAAYGFTWLDFDEETGLHIVVRDVIERDGRKMRALAFARAPERD